MMQPQRPAKLRVWTPFLFSLVMIAGMVLGFRLHDTLVNKRDITDRTDRIDEIIDRIKEHYVDTVSTSMLYEDAVRGILTHLDPHTVYIPASELQTVNEGLEGSFFGIGVEYNIILDTIQVTSVVEKGPAEKAGIIPSDKIISVNDSVVAGNGITPARITKMLRGKQHSTVRVTVMDAVKGSLREVIIERDAIRIHSVEAAVMLDRSTGYVRIRNFADNTYDEFLDALKELKKQGMSQLIIDLRDNPGGYLPEATDILDELIGGDKLLVYTEGIHSEKEEYNAQHDGIFEEGRLVILIDEGSASASEILAGAVQDWDRGVIIGRRSFGKGLVQEQYDLSDGSALRLTIARYYTPSGRCIQRSFLNGREAYEQDFDRRFLSGELTGNDSLVQEDTAKYYTAKHRLVHGGGGVKPDVYVPYDTTMTPPALMALFMTDKLDLLIWKYYVRNKQQMDSYRSLDQFSKNFHLAPELLNNYLSSLPAISRLTAEKLLKNSLSHNYVIEHINATMARILFRGNGYYATKAHTDNVVQKALQVLNSGTYSQIISR